MKVVREGPGIREEVAGRTSVEDVGHPNNECESDESEKDHWIFKERHRVNCKQHPSISQDTKIPRPP